MIDLDWRIILRSDSPILTVSELNAQAKRLLETEFGSVRLRGEIGEVTKSHAGHYYFSLKDENAEIRCVLFASAIYRNRIKQRPEHGREVVLDGQVTLYAVRGSFQFMVQNLQFEETREGALFRQFQLLKKELEEKGFFLEERKKQLPKHPKRVGIVTSASGAAVHDIIRAFNRRNPTIQLLIYPTAVQGDSAPDEIAAAIKLANQRKEIDVLLVSRGGGSLEDLAAFNDRIVAEAIYASEIPVVTGIGHQTDVSIADYVADKPMATPTAAAEHISTPAMDEMLKILSNLESALHDKVLARLNERGQRLDLAERSLKHPEQRIADLQNQFHSFHERLVLMIRNSISDRSGKIDVIHQRLLNRSPATAIDQIDNRLDAAAENLRRSIKSLHEKNAAHIELLAKQLEAMDPHATLSRGYAIVRKKSDDTILTDASAASAGDKVKAQLAKGSIDLEVESVSS